MCKQHVNPAELLTARLLLLNIDLQHRLGKKAPLQLLTVEWQLACLGQARGTAGFPEGEDLVAPLMHQLEVLSSTSHGRGGEVEAWNSSWETSSLCSLLAFRDVL